MANAGKQFLGSAALQCVSERRSRISRRDVAVFLFQGFCVLVVGLFLANSAWGIHQTGFGKSLNPNWQPPVWILSLIPVGLLLMIAAPARPFLGCLVYLVLVHFGPWYGQSTEWLFAIRLPEMLTLLMVTGWIAWCVRERQWDWNWIRSSPLIWILLAFWLWSVTCELVARFAAPEIESDLKRSVWRFSSTVAMALLTYRFCKRQELVALAICVAATLLIRGFCFPDTVHLDGDLAMLLVVALPLAGLLVSWSDRWPERFAALGLFAGIAYLLIMTHSRGAAVGAAAAVVAFTFTLRRWMPLALAVGTVIFAAVLAWQPVFWQRFVDIQRRTGHWDSAQQRLELWDVNFAIARDYPLFGVGPGRSQFYVRHFKPDADKLNPHNSFLATLSETGVPGLILYSILMCGCLAMAWRLAMQRQNVIARRFGQAVLTSLVAYLVTGCFTSRENLALPYMLCGVCIAWYHLTRSGLCAGEGNLTVKVVGT